MSRYFKPANAALVISILALISAVVGSAMADPRSGATISASAVKKAQRKAAVALKKAKKALSIARTTRKQKGPQGDPGPAGATGPPGAAATSLFAFVRDPGGEAVIDYGRGVTNVAEPPATMGEYILTFDRDLEKCVAQVTIGLGDPANAAGLYVAGPSVVLLPELGPDQLRVDLAAGDSSFMISVLC